MFRYGLRRLLHSIPLLLAVVVAVFLLMEAAPGDPIQAMVGEFPASPAFIEQITKKYQLDRPMHERLVAYVGNVLRGDLGHSLSNRRPVATLLWERLPNSVLLALSGLGFAAVVGVLLGVVAATIRHRTIDTAITVLALTGFALPVFWLGQVLIIIFAMNLGWLPSQGMRSMRVPAAGLELWLSVAWHLILPMLAVAAREIGLNARITRTSMRETMNRDYITTLRAMGLSESRIMWRHGLKNAMLPVVTVVGYNFGFALAGTILIETVFAWPGVGRLLYDAVTTRDNIVVVGVFLLTAVLVVLVNLLTDIIYGFLDPRIRTER